MKKITGLALASVAVLALSGCTGSDFDAPTNLDLSVDGHNAGNYNKGTLVIYNDNNSKANICEVYTMPDYASGGWGTNRLKSGRELSATGAPLTLETSNCDTGWDIKVVDCYGNEDKKIDYMRYCDERVTMTAYSH